MSLKFIINFEISEEWIFWSFALADKSPSLILFAASANELMGTINLFANCIPIIKEIIEPHKMTIPNQIQSTKWKSVKSPCRELSEIQP